MTVREFEPTCFQRQVVHNLASFGLDSAEIMACLFGDGDAPVTTDRFGVVFAAELAAGEALLRANPERECAGAARLRRATGGDLDAVTSLLREQCGWVERDRRIH